MDQNDISNIINQRNSSLSRLNKLFHSMDLFKGANQNEYHLLSEKILTQLEKGIDLKKIKGILEYELVVRYGLFHYEFDSEQLINDIFNCWKKC
ncbi:hypothetical protein PFY12_15140 [Chryseobacterium camelliae]|uniref:Uncharacterized protein n=1 Tax=Chryseobacterium camelliae TaxID=1265445 RepID=A0ABY7QL39_9FLAO|nr:hypothetical protein [Chryseobacterium camelliae]WBV60355.1 hypothetical protein PFY12_15140 [Chryseobacterium camelliae]